MKLSSEFENALVYATRAHDGGKTGTLWYYRALVSGFGEAKRMRPLVQELDRVVSKLEGVANNGKSVEHMRKIAVIGYPPVDSPQSAVKVAIASKGRRYRQR